MIDDHISECEPCCETIVSLSTDDTFVGMLQEARQLSGDAAAGRTRTATASDSDPTGIPAALLEHSRYEILGLIGKGGMGDVYQARHRMMDRAVALKIIKPEFVCKPEAVSRFHREVKAAARLSHPNIVTSHDAEQADDVHYLVMEYVDGINLAQTVGKRGALPIADACDYVRQAAIGLQHAHEQGMVHRDIKPHNLMVTEDGTVKILDFGLASLAPSTLPDADTVEVRSDLTSAGAIMGTPDFISPEQAEDARSADIRSDIYSLGSTLYFLLSGRPPFNDGSVMSKLKSQAQAEPEPLASLRDDIPAELLAVVTRMTAKDPDKRFQTPAEVADVLESCSQASQLDGAESARQEPSSGGNLSGSGAHKPGTNDMNPDGLLVLAKGLFYISWIPVALICYELWAFNDTSAVEAGYRTWAYMLVTLCLSSVAGVVFGIHKYKSRRSQHQNIGNGSGSGFAGGNGNRGSRVWLWLGFAFMAFFIQQAMQSNGGDDQDNQVRATLGELDSYIMSMMTSPHDLVFLNLGEIGTDENYVVLEPIEGGVTIRLPVFDGKPWDKRQSQYVRRLKEMGKTLSLPLEEESEVRNGSIEGVNFTFTVAGDPQTVADKIQQVITKTFQVESSENCRFTYRNLPAGDATDKGKETKVVFADEFVREHQRGEKVYFGEINNWIYLIPRQRRTENPLKRDSDIWGTDLRLLPSGFAGRIRQGGTALGEQGVSTSSQPTSAAKSEFNLEGKSVTGGSAGLPKVHKWHFKGREVGGLKVQLLLVQNGKAEMVQEFDFEELPAEFANEVRLEVRDPAGADHKRELKAILYVESPTDSRCRTTNEDIGLSTTLEAPFSASREQAGLQQVDADQTELLFAQGYWKGDFQHGTSMESMTEATKDRGATFVFVTLDWKPVDGRDSK